MYYIMIISKNPNDRFYSGSVHTNQNFENLNEARKRAKYYCKVFKKDFGVEGKVIFSNKKFTNRRVSYWYLHD